MSTEQREVMKRVKAFQAEVASGLSENIGAPDRSVDDLWKDLSGLLVQAGNDILGFARCHQPDWFTSNQEIITPLLEERRLCLNRWRASGLAHDHSLFKSARLKARAEVRCAKNRWLADYASQIERDRCVGSIWSSIRVIQRSYHGLCPMPKTAIRDDSGELCKSIQAQCDQWQRQFTRVLNVQSQFDPSVFHHLRMRPVREDLDALPLPEELHDAVQSLAHKAPGESGILPEMVKHAGAVFHSALLSLVHRVWQERSVLQAWRNAELVPIPKKGDPTRCDNWRGIALLDVIGKVVGLLIQTRLQRLAESELPESQCGFRTGRSCTDQIFSTRQSIEKFYEHRTPGFLVFIDLRKVYDSISSEALWKGLKILGMPPTLLAIITSFNDGMTTQVCVGTTSTEKIDMKNRLRQGCSTAPILFNLFFALLLERWQAEVAESCLGVYLKFNINGNLFNKSRTKHHRSSVSDFEFADDAVLVALSHQTSELALNVFARVAADFGLTVNFTKTKAMSCSAGLVEGDLRPLYVAGQYVENVPSFVYLGSLISPDSRAGPKVECRIANASRAFGALRCVFDDCHLSVKTKRMVYQACVMSVLLYGAECWPLLKADEARLDAFHHRCLQAILRVTRWDQQLHHVTNKGLRECWEDVGLMSDQVRSRRLQRLGHVARMDNERLPKQLLFGWLLQTRPTEGPRLRWKDRVQSDLRQLQVEDWFANAQDRPAWQKVCHTLPSPGVPKLHLCSSCQRLFKSKAGLTRHKCAAVRQLPICEQPGAQQCPKCHRWFKSPGGMAVHRCRPVETPSESLEPETSTIRFPATNQSCCAFHCIICARCFRSRPGFQRHNCKRGTRGTGDRSTFQHSCSGCERRFRFPRDLSRHKCRV